ncbi:MAG TPA: hypothetical protein VJL88_12515, partial [Nitrospira sp.]|nr:hypothetical protein [Nitrospira sp.]
MCMLKHSDNMISRRQEVGRGLRLAVDRFGDRLDHPATVHDINILSVIASESYTDFVDGLQREIAESLSARSRKASQAYFTGKQLQTPEGLVTVVEPLANVPACRQDEAFLGRRNAHRRRACGACRERGSRLHQRNPAQD